MKISVHGVTVNHRHGNDVMVATTSEELYEQLAQFVGNYVDETTKEEEINALLERGDNAEAVGMVFRESSVGIRRFLRA